MRHDIYLEAGAKRVFACAVDWPGWCRSGPDEDAALQALFDYGPRYAAALRSARLGFAAPSIILERDYAPAAPAEHARFASILRAARHTLAHIWEIERRLLAGGPSPRRSAS